MLYNYCPNCYSLNVGYKPETRQHKCNSCGFIGTCKQDSIDKINELRKGKTLTNQSFEKTRDREEFNLDLDDEDFGLESIEDKEEKPFRNSVSNYSSKERPSQKSANAHIGADQRVKKKFGDKSVNSDWELL
jgi:transcription initiation factor TFIIIB Brf1 subunit/transcription initiation factor TFIIB